MLDWTSTDTDTDTDKSVVNQFVRNADILRLTIGTLTFIWYFVSFDMVIPAMIKDFGDVDSMLWNAACWDGDFLFDVILSSGLYLWSNIFPEGT